MFFDCLVRMFFFFFDHDNCLLDLIVAGVEERERERECVCVVF